MSRRLYSPLIRFHPLCPKNDRGGGAAREEEETPKTPRIVSDSPGTDDEGKFPKRFPRRNEPNSPERSFHGELDSKAAVTAGVNEYRRGGSSAVLQSVSLIRRCTVKFARVGPLPAGKASFDAVRANRPFRRSERKRDEERKWATRSQELPART